MQTAFGSGVLIGAANQDAFGNPLATPTPVQFGVLQDISLDISFDTKELYGSNQFPVAIGRGKGKATGKAKFAQINGLMLNSLFFGQTLTAGSLSDYIDVTGSASETSLTPTVPNGGTWVRDLGVRSAVGIPLIRVVSSPAAGQYSVSSGVYTFASADAGTTIYISFQFTASSTVARKSVVANLPMGYAPTFAVDFYTAQNGKPLTISAGSCLTTKFSLATKQDDFTIPEFDFSMFADAAGNLLSYSTAE